MKWVVRFAVICLAGIAGVLGLAWAFGLLEGLGWNTNVAVAAALGILFTSALGAGLMALVFYSSRSHVDDDVWRVREEPDRKDDTR
jgi:hypothetical protein